MNKTFNITGWETIKIIPKERYFVDEDGCIQERLNVYQNQLFDKGELYKTDDLHTQVVEFSERIIMSPITYETMSMPWLTGTELKDNR